MAKSNNQKPLGLTLKLNQFTPIDNIDGHDVPRIDPKTKEPVVIKTFECKMSILGKQITFKPVVKEASEKGLLLDFFALTEKDELPVKIVENKLTNAETGESTSYYEFLVYLDERDDIHQIRMKVPDADKAKFKMAVREYYEGYKLPEKMEAIRQERRKWAEEHYSKNK